MVDRNMEMYKVQQLKSGGCLQEQSIFHNSPQNP